MAVISILEIFYLLLTIAVVGYIFSGLKRNIDANPFQQYKWFDWEDFKFSALIAAPGIIFHELAHKFVALGFGLEAVYQVWPLGLLIGVALKALGSGFVLLAPGYVAISGANILQSSLTAFAGPAMNLILWLGATFLLKNSKDMSHKKAVSLELLRSINKWLFIFNMIPLPPLDGFKVVEPLLATIF